MTQYYWVIKMLVILLQKSWDQQKYIKEKPMGKFFKNNSSKAEMNNPVGQSSTAKRLPQLNLLPSIHAQMS